MVTSVVLWQEFLQKICKCIDLNGDITTLQMSHLMTKPTEMCLVKTDQPGHPPSLIRVFTVRMKKAWVLSYPLSTQQRLWSDWADAQADLSLRWAHSHFVGFVMRRLKIFYLPAMFNCHSQAMEDGDKDKGADPQAAEPQAEQQEPMDQ